ncbi:MAG TPA: class I SAM-dependent methyltransferase [Vicinamibacterales bacterium]|nr:class I SAM-dependent methyltransferase [Vicinamibacterales bacterium]HPW20166.1 class I SAM-dependent methyltransferase [Vicinamibacterales bacterium]
MAGDRPSVRRGEYASRGDYHRVLDEAWDYRPTYLAKMAAVRRHLDTLPPGTRVLDAGCGEGVLVQDYAGRLDIEGVDLNCSGDRIRTGSVTALPWPGGAFEQVLCLDVLEHLAFGEQDAALSEIFRVLRPCGIALLSVPNLAHLQSRAHFLLTGRLIRTASPVKHPGDRPAGEYLALARSAGFDVVRRRGIFPTVPVLTALVRRHPVSLQWLHAALTRAIPVPGWCFLNLIWLRKPAAAAGRSA